jgi:hypothetical protein
MKGVAYEAILIIGVLVAVGFSLFQLRGILYGQQLIGKEEVVYAFAKDLESVVDKAIATTGDAAFVYYPSIKQYSVVIKNNTVTVLDKVSNLSAYFSKYFTLVDNSFEDCEKIFVFKKEEKIFITCKCFELGEACSDSLQCCSGFCNMTSGKCEEMPVCPASRVCTGAPEAVKIGGKDCCPADKPVCDKQHCCPMDKPKWCERYKECMNESEYETKCKKWRLVFVPLNFEANPSDEHEYKTFANSVFNFWLQESPFRDCPNNGRDRIDMRIILPSESSTCVIDCRGVCSPWSCPPGDTCITSAIRCANAVLGSGNWDKLVGISKVGWPYYLGGIVCGMGPWSPATCTDGPASSTWYKSICSAQAPGQANPIGITVHEMGHTLKLCHECGLPRPNECPNPDVTDINYIMCYGTNRYFSPGSYNYLKGVTNGYCGEKSSIAKFLEDC